MDELYTIRDTTSWAGMRTLHLMRRDEINAQEVIEREIADGWQLEIWYQWKDLELDLNHLYTAWRSKMVNCEMMAYAVGKGGMVEAIQRAAAMYQRKFGRQPDHMMVREETWKEQGAGRVALQVEGGEQEIQVVEVKKGWQVGVVGVWKA